MNHSKTPQSLSLTDSRAYLAATLLVTGNIVFPQLCHLIPMGGKILLPIFFFTLVGAYRYGMAVGLATAVLSPVMSSLLSGLPSEAMLPPMLAQSALLATVAALVARKTGRVSAGLLAAVAVPCQMAGLVIERLMTTTDGTLLASLGMAVPGLLLQVFGGLYLINKL